MTDKSWKASRHEPPETKHTRIIYRYRESNYIGSDGEIVRAEKLIPMHNKSCSGVECTTCWFIDEILEEQIPNYGISMPNNLNDGDLVELVYVPDAPDWESGISDGGEVEAKIYKEK